MTLTPGTRLGPYEIVSAIGAGGMGEVYRARDTRLNRDVAIKVLPQSFADDPDRLARFAREAQMLAALNHPNVAQIYGLEQSGSTRALAMEFVDGPTLQERSEAGAIPFDEALAITRQICAALEAAHDRGIIHRDLKPANIKIRPDGTVKVLDFGLAKAGDAGPSSANVTASPTMTSPAMTGVGVILGTAAYMSPEQARGRAVDKRADIWALGVILYEMLSGRRAFAGDDVSEVMAGVIKSDPDWSALPMDTPRAVRAVLARCLRKDPTERIRDAGDVRLALDGAFESAAPERPVAARRSKIVRWLWPSAAAAAAIVAGAVALVHFREQPPAVHPIRFEISLPASVAALAVSPDGRSVAFPGPGADGRAVLWVHSFDSGQARPLPVTALGNVAMPFWSPDGRFIAFFAADKLRKVDAAGGSVQTICDVPQNAAPRGGTWNADDVIVFSRFGGGLARVPAAGGTPIELTTLDPVNAEVEHAGPRFLPDGSHVLYLRRSAGTESGVHVASIDTKPGDPRPQRLVPTDYGVGYMAGPTRDRGYVLFLREGTLMAQLFDNTRLQMVEQPVPIVEQVADMGRPFGLFSVSDAGVLTYRPSVAVNGAVQWVDRGGREVGQVIKGSLPTPRFPRLSPDGQRLVLTLAGDIWVYDIGGRPPIRLTSDAGNYSPIWTNDGRHIVFETSAGTLATIAADGSSAGRTPVANSGNSHTHPHALSPDGSELVAVVLGGPPTGVDVMGLSMRAKAAPRPIVHTTAREGFEGTSLSPDGRWLAFVSDTTGQREIWVQAYPTGGAPVRISPNGGAEPIWARKGGELYYLEGRRVMVVPVQTSSTFDFKPAAPLFDSRYEHGPQPPTFDVAADGRFILIKPDQADRPTMSVVFNWTELLKGRQ